MLVAGLLGCATGRNYPDPDGPRYVGGTADLDYDALLAGAGLRLVRDDRWHIEELPDATAAQRTVREGWISGHHQ